MWLDKFLCFNKRSRVYPRSFIWDDFDLIGIKRNWINLCNQSRFSNIILLKLWFLFRGCKSISNSSVIVRTSDFSSWTHFPLVTVARLVLQCKLVDLVNGATQVFPCNAIVILLLRRFEECCNTINNLVGFWSQTEIECMLPELNPLDNSFYVYAIAFTVHEVEKSLEVFLLLCTLSS